jgi:SAM-dependent methyltransferase
MKFSDIFAPHRATNLFRARRFLRFRSVLTDGHAPGAPIRILDIGGDADYWRAFAHLWRDLSLQITILNLYPPDERSQGFEYRQGDGCNLKGIEDREFDVVHSNSVIEHVGDWSRMVAFAIEIRRVGKRYFVQTPNFWFPIEPHVRLPAFHWLPEQLRYRLLIRRSWGFIERSSDLAAAMDELDHMRLLDRGQMRVLFPDAVIERERLMGLTKSLMAIRA